MGICQQSGNVSVSGVLDDGMASVRSGYHVLVPLLPLHYKMGTLVSMRFIRPLLYPSSPPHKLLSHTHRLSLIPSRSQTHRLTMSTSSVTSAAKPDVIPRPSASLVVVNDRNEILLVHRNPKARSFGGMTVRLISHLKLGVLMVGWISRSSQAETMTPSKTPH